MLALVVGSLLAVAALAFVLWPLVRGSIVAEPRMPRMPRRASEQAPEASAIEALREIEFDQATGKLSPEDYASLRASYTPLALAELREADAADAANAAHAADARAVPASSTELDPAEQLITRAKALAAAKGSGAAKACPSHGARPEPDAVFCSDCGRFLGAACLRCGAPADNDRARFCTECGASLAA
jgi:hypothetical protein